MRLVPVIIVLAAIAVGMVHIRRQQVACAHEIQSLRSREVQLRRQLWDQHARLGYLTSPQRVAAAAEDEPQDEEFAQLPVSSEGAAR